MSASARRRVQFSTVRPLSAGGLALWPCISGGFLTVYILVYILKLKVGGMETVKVFKSGNSQAVRIPKNYTIDDTELFIHRVGSSIVLTPKQDVWKSFENSIDKFSDDLFEDGREQPGMQERENF